ncbi:MAG: anthranilate phosphoribosyltransferase [Planctomycetaceae bacterium]
MTKGADTTGQPGDATPPDADRLAADLRGGRRADPDDVRRLVEGVLAGTVPLDAFGRWLVTLADSGETAAEVAGVAAALRDRMLRLPAPPQSPVADTCGTGGDGSGSFNVSTAAALVVAAAGQPVAKHGNRAVSSRTGSADVLERLGVRIDAPAAVAAACLRDLGICFCLAPTHHPAMARVGPLRRALGRPTVFNLVGPLCNPAGAGVQVIGVGRAAAREPVAEAARLLGARRALVVTGHLGADERVFDEVSLFGPTDVIDVSAAGVRRFRWTPKDFGLVTLPPARLADLEVDGPESSATAIRGVLAGEPGPRRDVVVLNAAAVLWAAGRGGDPAASRALAEHAIDSGAATRLLAAFVARSNTVP